MVSLGAGEMRVLPINYTEEIRRYQIAPTLRVDLVKLFERHNLKPARKRFADTSVAYKTAYRRFVNTCSAFQDLARLGYGIERLANFKEKHVLVLVRDWEAAGQAPGTIENKLSYLRWVAKWVGKPAMVKAGKTYAAHPESLRRSGVAQTDKSWEGNGVDALKVIEEVRGLDKLVAAQVEIACAMGLRAEEAMLKRPWVALNDALTRGAVRVEYGTKGGRPRDVVLHDVVQIEVLSRAVMLARAPDATLIPPNRTYDQWKNHFYYVCRKCGIKKDTSDGGLGVTIHGMRHGFVQRLFEHLTGLPAPIKCVDGVEYDHAQYCAAMSTVVEAVGHSDRYKAGAYLGSPRALRRLREALKNAKKG